MNYKIRNRWLIVLGALSAQFAIGSLYAWSLFNVPISEAFGWELSSVVTTYAISLVSFSLSTIVSGKMQIEKGPRKTALLGGLLFSGGILLSSFATSPYILYLTYGVMGGAGVGFVYVCPLSTLVKWFPNNKGAVTGVATAGFALGAVIFKIIITGMLDVSVYTPELISNTFLTLGVIYFVMTIGGALLLDEPVEFKQVVKVHTYTKNYTRREVLKTSNFYKLLLSDLLALMPGLLIIGLAKDIGLANGFDYVAASSIVSYIAIFNAFGRFASGNLADKIGALRIYKFMYFATIVALGMLAFLDLNQSFLLIVVLCVVGIAYGSFLSLVPTIVGQLFGAKYFSANYSLVFQAYGIAALLGIAIKKQVTFEQAFLISMVTAVLGLIIATRIKQEKKV